jgi:hypothetical protein
MPNKVIAPGWSAVPVPKPIGSTKLTKGQKQFNKLLARLKAQRKELTKWQTFKQVYHDRLSGEYQPLARRLRETRIGTAKLLDQAMERKQLKKRERDMVWETLRGLLTVLLADEEDAELVTLHDKYADVSFHDQRQKQMDRMRESALEDFGVDADAYEGAETPEEFAAWIAEQARAMAAESPETDAGAAADGAADADGDLDGEGAELDAADGGGPGAGGGKGAKKSARELRESQVAEGGLRSVREVFRKLVSELHPDRETNPVERARKTILMQKVNKAYKTGDLFTLLEMQRSLEREDAADYAGLPEERFKHYNHVLEQQSQRLRSELSALVSPFEIAIGDALTRKITPDDVKRALEADIIEIKGVLRTVEIDQAHFNTLLRLKPSLANYREEPFLDGYQKGRRRRQ